jgi:RHS repeat-associated protein
MTLSGEKTELESQLVQAEGETFVYDALGRRLEQGNVSYLYIGDEEIGAFENHKPKELKIPGATPIAIEIGGKPYFPIQDAQGTIRFLIDSDTKEIVQQNDSDAFGVGLTDAIPYAYAGKRYDPKLGLVYFGKRYYDPTFRRWLTADPIGPEDHSNLYQYVFNNPLRYQDPNGQFAFAIPLVFWGAELALPAISTVISWIACGAVVGAVSYSSYKVIEAFNEAAGASSFSGDTVHEFISLEQMQTRGTVDPNLPANPDDLLKRPGWKETTHPEAGENGRRTFENGETGEKLEHDKARPEEPGHKGHDHYHRPNPYSTQGRHDKYLDANGNPVRDHSGASHIYHPDNVWWK